MNFTSQKYVTEFIGTFFLVLTVGCTVIAGVSGAIAPLAIALLNGYDLCREGHFRCALIIRSDAGCLATWAPWNE